MTVSFSMIEKYWKSQWVQDLDNTRTSSYVNMHVYYVYRHMHISYHNIYVYISWKNKKVQHLDYPTFLYKFIYIYGLYVYVYMYMNYIPSFPMSLTGGSQKPASSPDDNHPPQRRHGGEHRRLCLALRRKTGGKWWMGYPLINQQTGGLPTNRCFYQMFFLPTNRWVTLW